MKKDKVRFPGQIVNLIFLFMTVLMVFPFFFYYKFSSVNEEILMYNRLKAGAFGREVSRYFGEIPLNPEDVSAELRTLPLMENIQIEIYDGKGNLLSKRKSEPLERETSDTALYQGVRKLLNPLRKRLYAGEKEKDPEEITSRLLYEAYQARDGAGYLFTTGEIGDRTLYLSYPIYKYPREISRVRGVLLLEYRDTAAKAIMQKQRNQFALTCLIFTALLLCYVLYILTFLVLPLRNLLRRTLSIIERTGYQFPRKPVTEKKDEIGEMARSLNRMEEMLVRSDRKTEQYMRELKHIVRNPLSVIRAALEGLMMHNKSERDRKFSGIILKNLSRIDNYISSYSDISDALIPNRPVEEIDLIAFLQEIVRNYTPLAESRGILFALTPPSYDIVWRGFSSPLSYAVEQVINNAMDFSPEKGRVKMEASKEGNKIRITIKDQGPGIPDGKEESIFQQYVSFRKKRQVKHTGTGLFLAMNVLQKIGGNISGKNEGSGGAVFIITLPMRS